MGISGFLEFLLSAITAISTGALVFVAWQQNAMNKHQITTIFLDVADRWTAIYPTRNHILNSALVTREDLVRVYGQNYKNFLDTEQWRAVRSLCNFFEILGLLVRKNYISREELFTIVSVDVFAEQVNGETHEVPEGVLYSKLKGYIDFLRETYKTNLYSNYDRHLLPEYRKYIGRKPDMPAHAEHEFF